MAYGLKASSCDPLSRDGFINIFQAVHFSAAKFDMGYERNMSFLLIAKSPKALKKVLKIGLGSCKKTSTGGNVFGGSGNL